MSMVDLLVLNSWMTVLSFVILPTALWVLIDASALKVSKGKLGGGFFDMGVGGWFFSCLLLWVVAFPAYLAKRPEYKRIQQAPLAAADGLADLERLADLRDKGVLTSEEFEQKKAEMLRRV